MSWSELKRAAVAFVRREWWIVAIALVAALAAAVIVGGAPKTVYQVQATFRADTTLISKYKGVPLPDDVVRDVASSATARAAIAASAGVPVAQVSGLRMSGFGNPQNRMLVTFSAPSQETALAVVRAADEAVLAYVNGRTSIERDNYAAAVEQADTEIASLQATLGSAKLDSYQRADLGYKLWQVQSARIAAKDVVDILSHIYELQAEPVATASSSSHALESRAAAALLAGLFVGLVIGGFREAWLRRRDAARK